MDSALVYRDMDIGTAKPDRATERAGYPILIDLVTPEERYSAAQFPRRRAPAMGQIVARDNIPLLVGGTMLYFGRCAGSPTCPGRPAMRRAPTTRPPGAIRLAAARRLAQLDPGRGTLELATPAHQRARGSSALPAARSRTATRGTDDR